MDVPQRLGSLILGLAAVIAVPAAADPLPRGEQLRVALRSTDTLLAQFADSFTIRGLRFVDPACAKRFSRSRRIRGRERAVFTACLRDLQPGVAQRALGNRIRLTAFWAHDGGAAQLVFEARLHRDRIDALAPPSASGEHDATTTVLNPTLLTFTPSARTLAAMARANVAYSTAELKVCRDRKGVVRSRRIVTSSKLAVFDQEVIRRAAVIKKLDPVSVDGVPINLCDLVPVTARRLDASLVPMTIRRPDASPAQPR